MNKNQFSNQVNHVATMLVVEDIDRSLNFYCDIFGFEVKRYEKGFIALVQFKNIQLYFIPVSPPTADKPEIELTNLNTKGKTSVSIVFNVEDCDEVYNHLLEKGLKFQTLPKTPPWGGRRCFAIDPDGYLIEIEQGT